MLAAANRLRRHGDYQRVYKSSRKQFGKQMSYFFLLRVPQPVNGKRVLLQEGAGPRIGLTVSRAMGKAVDRNRIKRRMREAVRRHLGSLQASVDVVLHPRRTAAQVEFSQLEKDVAQVFAAIQQAADGRLPATGSRQ